MTRKNVRKPYVENGCYHLYNRGVNKELIFRDEADYKMFIFLLKLYLGEKDHASVPLKGRPLGYYYKIRNFNKQITVLAYCLMPNHWHLLIRQKESRAIVGFMQALNTKYSMYFNKKYQRVGTIYQGPYRGILADNDEHALYLSRYIHLNPQSNYRSYSFSSYLWYVRKLKNDWFDSNPVLDYFARRQPVGAKKVQTYEAYVRRKSGEEIDALGSDPRV